MTDFAGFGPDFSAFFTELGVEQNRDWFQANKARYEDAVKAPFRDLILALNEAPGGPDAEGADPRRRYLFYPAL